MKRNVLTSVIAIILVLVVGVVGYNSYHNIKLQNLIEENSTKYTLNGVDIYVHGKNHKGMFFEDTGQHHRIEYEIFSDLICSVIVTNMDEYNRDVIVHSTVQNIEKMFEDYGVEISDSKVMSGMNRGVIWVEGVLPQGNTTVQIVQYFTLPNHSVAFTYSVGNMEIYEDVVYSEMDINMAHMDYLYPNRFN